MKISSSKTRLAWITFIIALVFRLIYWRQSSENPLLYIPLLDEEYYVEYAKSILSGRNGESFQAFYMDPLYAYFLGILFHLFDNSLLVPRLLQIALDSLTASLLLLIGARLWSIRAGFIAGLIYAAYPVAWFYSLTLLKTTLTTHFLVLYSLLFLVLSENNDRKLAWTKWLLLGFLAAAGVYLRGYLILLIPLSMLVILVLKLRSLPAYTAGTLLVFITVGTTNLVQHSRFSVLVGNSGITLYSANNPENPQGTYSKPGFVTTNHPKLLLRQYQKEAEHRLHRKLDIGEVSSYWRNQTFAYWFGNSHVLPRLLYHKLKNLVTHEEIANNLSVKQASVFAPILIPAIPFYSLILALGLPGLLLAALQDRRISILFMLPAVIVITSLLFYSSSRFRFPMIPALILGTAYLACIPWRQPWKHTHKLLLSLIPIIFIISMASKGPANNPHQGDLNLAIAYTRLGQADKALTLLIDKEKSLGHLAVFHSTMGFALMIKKEYMPAYQYSMRAATINPNDTIALHNAAISALELKKYRESLRLFNKIYDLTANPEYLYWMGRCQLLLGKRDYARKLLLSATQHLSSKNRYFQSAQQLLLEIQRDTGRTE